MHPPSKGAKDCNNIGLAYSHYRNFPKVSNAKDFGLWLEQLKQHRLYQQHQMNTANPSPMMSPEDIQQAGSMLPPSERAAAFMASPRNSLSRGMRPPPGGGRWQQEFNSMDDNMTAQLLSVQNQALQLAMLVQRIEDEQNASLGHTGMEESGTDGSKRSPLTNLLRL